MPASIDSSAAEIRESQEGLLCRMVRLCAQRHPYYRQVFADQGLHPDDLADLDALQRLPLTYKRDYIGAPERFRLETEGLPDVERTGWDMAYTTGTTTGSPAPFHSTAHDFFGIVHASRNMCAIRGITARDVVANLFPVNGFPQGAFIRVHAAAMGTGFSLLVAAPGKVDTVFDVHRSTNEIVDWLIDRQPTVLWGVPSYIRRLLTVVANVGGSLASVRFLAMSGEVLSPGLRADLRGRLAAVGAHEVITNNSLGMTEMQCGLVECVEGSGFHNPAPDLFFFEVVDEATGLRVPDGERGLLCLTHLNRRGTVLLRYVVGDIVTQTHEPCPHCGRAVDRIVTNPVRTAELYKVKGNLVDPTMVGADLSAVPGVEEYRIIFTKEDQDDPYSPDAVVIQLAGPAGDTEPGRAAIADLVKRAISITPRVESVPADHIYDGLAMKSRRVLDLRPSVAEQP